jgi:hypothetical protein
MREKRIVPAPTQDPMCEGEIVGIVSFIILLHLTMYMVLRHLKILNDVATFTM